MPLFAYALIWYCIRPHFCTHFAAPPLLYFCTVRTFVLFVVYYMNSIFGGCAVAPL